MLVCRCKTGHGFYVGLHMATNTHALNLKYPVKYGVNSSRTASPYHIGVRHAVVSVLSPWPPLENEFPD